MTICPAYQTHQLVKGDKLRLHKTGSVLRSEQFSTVTQNDCLLDFILFFRKGIFECLQILTKIRPNFILCSQMTWRSEYEEIKLLFNFG